MAEAITNARAGERRLTVRAISAGTQAGTAVNPLALAALAEINIPVTGLTPKALTQDMANAADAVITMGCGVNAGACPARFLVADDWELDDPTGQDLNAVRRIRDQITAHVDTLLNTFEAAL